MHPSLVLIKQHTSEAHCKDSILMIQNMDPAFHAQRDVSVQISITRQETYEMTPNEQN